MRNVSFVEQVYESTESGVGVSLRLQSKQLLRGLISAEHLANVPLS